jgi:hypothetical protein
MSKIIPLLFTLYLFLVPLGGVLATVPLAQPLPATIGQLTGGILLLMFYVLKFKQKWSLSSAAVLASVGLTIVIEYVLLTSRYAVRLDETLRWLTFIWLIPIVEWIIRQFGAKKLVVITVVIASLHAQWALAQFVLQQDLGLQYLGESQLGVNLPGVAKFALFDQSVKVIRAYGPYPHPNSFVAATVGALVLLSFYRKIFPKYFYLILSGLFVITLLIEFSRMGWLALSIFLVSRFITEFKRSHDSPRWSSLKTTLILIFVVILIFSPFLISRLSDPADAALSERQLGVQWSLNIIATLPVWHGVGLGQYDAALQQYVEQHQIRYFPWQIAPVHSIPLLLVAEWGLLAALALVGAGIWCAWRYLATQQRWLLGVLIATVAPLALFDHYLLTQTAPLLFSFLAGRLVLGMDWLIPRSADSPEAEQ